MRLTFVLGTAAELIKVYPVARLASEAGHEVHYLATGQSRENFLMQFRDFALPEPSLSWLVPGADLETSSNALRWFARALWATGRRDLLPTGGFVLVHGDTLSTLVGAVAGRRQGLPVVHIEAGLRSPSLLNPFPEEITRRLVSRLARFHMAPDATAAGNLHGRDGRIIDTGGNTLLDAVRMAGSESATGHPEGEPSGSGYAVVNIHRFENLNSRERWARIIETLLLAARRRKLVMVMHPQTRHMLQKDAGTMEQLRAAGCELRERMPFSAFMRLLKGAEFLISDGGSNQEECSYLGKPCLLLRQSTERTEGLNGCCVLSRFDTTVIQQFLENPRAFSMPPMAANVSPSRRILSTLMESA